MYRYDYQNQTDLLTSAISPDDVRTQYEYLNGHISAIQNDRPFRSSIGYTYNQDGTIATTNISAGNRTNFQLNYKYDKDGLVIGVNALSFIRNAFGVISQSKLGVLSDRISFDSVGLPTQRVVMKDNKALVTKSFQRDRVGRIVKTSTIGLGLKGTFDVDYKYDKAGRLTYVEGLAFNRRSYKYDANGNRIELSKQGKVIKARYDDQDRLTNYGTLEYKYDQNGALKTKIEHKFDWSHKNFNSKLDTKKQTHYVYDVFGNLKSVTLPGGKRIEYIIDAQNRRIGKKLNGKFVQGFIYLNQTQIAAEIDANGNITKNFIYASKINSPDFMVMNGKRYRIISDQVGTPHLVLDTQSGSPVHVTYKDEFGDDLIGPFKRVEQKNLLPFGFAGGLYDPDTNLIRFGARDYDPETGRWTSKDPILFNGGDTNLYGYTFNDPVNFIDPNGMDATTGFIGSHEVIRITDPSSRTGVTYAEFYPDDGKGLYVSNTRKGQSLDFLKL